MNYNTNPITTRLTITRGWFQEYFPQDNLSYTSETSFFYKYYLLINFVMKKKKINLLRFSLSTDNKDIILAYFNVQKQLLKKRNRFWKISLKKKKFFKKRRQFLFKKAGYNYRFGKLKNVRFTKKNKKWVLRKNLRQLSLRTLAVFQINKWNKIFILNMIKNRNKYFVIKSKWKKKINATENNSY